MDLYVFNAKQLNFNKDGEDRENFVTLLMCARGVSFINFTVALIGIQDIRFINGKIDISVLPVCVMLSCGRGMGSKCKRHLPDLSKRQLRRKRP